MEPRPFGSTDLEVSPIGLGCARIGGIFQKDPQAFVDLLQRALGAGINFFDTADMYSQGESERLIGRAFRGRRGEVVIASKAGFVLPAQRRLIGMVKPIARPLIRLLGLKRASLPSAVRGQPAQDFSPAHLAKSVEGSLRRLGTGHLDLFQLHSPPASVVPLGDWREALERLKQAGKIRHYGIASESADTAQAALQCPGIASLQVTVNLLEQGAVEQVLPAARARKLAVIAREVFANGLLVKDAAAVDLKSYCSSPAEEQQRARQLEAARDLARSAGVPLPQLALQFALQLEGVSVALVGARTTEQLEGLLRLPAALPAAAQALRALAR